MTILASFVEAHSNRGAYHMGFVRDGLNLPRLLRLEIHSSSLLPTGCPINGSNKLAVQRQTDRQDLRTKTLDLRVVRLKKNHFV